MAQQVINVSTPNDGLGDQLRNSFIDVNSNFTELYDIKVDKVIGKDLSDNNFSDADVTKLAGIETGAEVNVQSDWLQTNNLLDDFIKNKPDTADFLLRHPVILPFDFVKNSENVINGLHGFFLKNGAESGIILNSSTPITGVTGIARVFAAVLAGSDTVGNFTITGTSVDRETGVETASDTEIIAVNGFSTDNSTVDSNGNPVRAFEGGYISAKVWKGSLTFSTTDLNLTEIRFAQVSFEQFNDSSLLEIETFDATYQITNTSAELDAYLYAVEVDANNICTVGVIAEFHHETGLATNEKYRKRIGNIGKNIDGIKSGVFIDLFTLPSNQEYFINFTMKVWGSKIDTVAFLLDNTLIVDSIVYGENLTAEDVVYSAPDGRFYKADNTSESTSTTQIRLIVESGNTGDEKNSIVQGIYRPLGVLVVGNEYLGVNGGFISSRPTVPGETVRLLSTAITTSKRYFNPASTYIAADGTSINGIPLSQSGSAKELFTATAAQTAFVLSSSPNNVDVYIDRVVQIETIDYTLSGDTVTTTDPIDEGSKVEIRKF